MAILRKGIAIERFQDLDPVAQGRTLVVQNKDRLIRLFFVLNKATVT